MRKIEFVDCSKSICLIGVADGISQCDYGASVARWLFEKHFSQDDIFLRGPVEISNQLKMYMQDLRKEFCQEFQDFPDMRASGASLSICVLRGSDAACFWVGDCPVFVSEINGPEFQTTQLTTADSERRSSILTDWFGGDSPFNLKERNVNIPDGAILTITSDGALCESHVLSYQYGETGYSEATIRTIVDNALSREWADDVSIVACRKRP